jgi:hypothetical protein
MDELIIVGIKRKRYSTNSVLSALWGVFPERSAQMVLNKAYARYGFKISYVPGI